MPKMIFAAAAASALALCCETGAAATTQDYPVRPVRLVIPFAPGGSSDLVARPVAQLMSERLGQSIVVDNRGGAGGVVGGQIVAGAPPDGYTLLLASSSGMSVAPIFTRLPYDPLRDFASVGQIIFSQYAFAVRPSLNVRTVKDAVDLARANPKKHTYGSPGRGTIGHLAGELFNSMAGVDLLHVPYKGAGPMMVDAIGGRIDFAFSGLSGMLPQIRSEKLRALAVTGAKRAAATPDLPTLSEAGLRGYEASVYYGLMGPAKLPSPIVTKLNAALREALKNPELTRTFVNQGNDPAPGTAEQLHALIGRDLQKWSKLARDAKINVD